MGRKRHTVEQIIGKLRTARLLDTSDTLDTRSGNSSITAL